MKNRFRFVRMRSWGERILVLSFMAALSFAPSQMKAASERETDDLRVYSYVSRPAGDVLERFGISKAEIGNYARNGDDQLYEGSRDALRVDIRRKKRERSAERCVGPNLDSHPVGGQEDGQAQSLRHDRAGRHRRAKVHR